MVDCVFSSSCVMLLVSTRLLRSSYRGLFSELKSLGRSPKRPLFTMLASISFPEEATTRFPREYDDTRRLVLSCGGCISSVQSDWFDLNGFCYGSAFLIYCY